MNKNIYILLLILIVEIYSTPPANCGTEATGTDEGKCSVCNTGYTGYPAGSGPYTACKTTIEHCQTYHATNDECDTCATNYKKIGGDVTATLPDGTDTHNFCYSESILTNCQYVNPNYDRCYKCSGTNVFTSDHTKCVAKIAGCKKHSSGATTTCEECYTGSDATSGATCACNSGRGTFDNTLQICEKIANCVGYNSNAECTKCDDTHILSGGKCETACTGSKKSFGGTTCFDVINDCETYNNDGSKCVGCTVASGKSVMKGGNDDGTCVACGSGHLVLGVDGYCYTDNGGNVANCAKYEGTTCVECKEELELKDGQCSPCYHPLVTLGKFCAADDQTYDEHCTAYGEDGYCSTCSTGYAVDGSHRCVKSSCSGGGDENNENKDKPSETTEANNASCVKLNVLFVVLLLSIFW